MDVAKGPTDNLYKFTALSGLALACLGIVLANNLYSSWTTADINASVSAQLISEIAAGRQTIADNHTQLFEYRRKEIETGKLDAAAVNQYHNDQMAYNEKAKKDMYDLIEIMQGAKLKAEVANSIESTFRTRMQLYVTLIIFGAVVSSVGFYLWYFRLQKFLDAKIASE